MTNSEHLAHFREGVETWNEWKANHLGLNPDLSWADLREANLSGVDLSGADLCGAILWKTTFADIDLSETRGLESCKHVGPSSIGIDTVFRSKGEIPETFLRGCGVPEPLITYARSLVGKPILFYSCFISYSSKDQEFANRLHADLRTTGSAAGSRRTT